MPNDIFACSKSSMDKVPSPRLEDLGWLGQAVDMSIFGYELRVCQEDLRRIYPPLHTPSSLTQHFSVLFSTVHGNITIIVADSFTSVACPFAASRPLPPPVGAPLAGQSLTSRLPRWTTGGWTFQESHAKNSELPIFWTIWTHFAQENEWLQEGWKVEWLTFEYGKLSVQSIAIHLPACLSVSPLHLCCVSTVSLLHLYRMSTIPLRYLCCILVLLRRRLLRPPPPPPPPPTQRWWQRLQVHRPRPLTDICLGDEWPFPDERILINNLLPIFWYESVLCLSVSQFVCLSPASFKSGAKNMERKFPALLQKPLISLGGAGVPGATWCHHFLVPLLVFFQGHLAKGSLGAATPKGSQAHCGTQLLWSASRARRCWAPTWTCEADVGTGKGLMLRWCCENWTSRKTMKNTTVRL